MKVPTPARQRGVQFNITPLIDVVFLLVIFFLVASHFARSEPTEVVDLPTASQTSEEDDPRRLIITVSPEGAYFVNAQQVTLDEIEGVIADGVGDNPETYAVRIRGDRQTPYSMIEPLMLICPKYGITRFGFHVIQRDE